MELTACLISLKVVGFVSRILARLVLMKIGIGIPVYTRTSFA